LNFDKENYKKFADAHAKPSPTVKNCLHAFLVGGGICAFAQGIIFVSTALGASKDDAGLISSVILVFISAVLTGLAVFEKIAKFAGAGTLVPITGFANSVVSPAIDSKAEGWVLGVGAKIFTVAGPVLLYGTLSGTLYGVLYWVFLLFF